MDLISHHQDNLGRAVLALSFWAPSGGGDSQPDFADQLALPSKASLDNDDAWSKVRQLLLGSATSLPMIDRPLPLVGVAEYFGFDPATKAPVLPTTSPTDFLQCPPGMECFRLKLLRATLFLSSGAFELTRVAEDPLVLQSKPINDYYWGSGCSTVVEHLPLDQEFADSNPARCWTFSLFYFFLSEVFLNMSLRRCKCNTIVVSNKMLSMGHIKLNVLKISKTFGTLFRGIQLVTMNRFRFSIFVDLLELA